MNPAHRDFHYYCEAIKWRASKYRYLFSMFQDIRSLRNYRRLAAANQSTTAVVGTPLALDLRLRGAGTVRCRPNTTDIQVFDDVFRRMYHLPPADIGSPNRILDLGCNIGLTVVHFATVFPQARILGVELDKSNFDLCLGNIRPYSQRCSVVLGAVWNQSDIELAYEGTEHWGFRISNDNIQDRRARTFTIDRLLDSMQWDSADFVKMDIEGAEQLILSSPASWAERVYCLKVEIHYPYTVDQCSSDLSRLGYRTKVEPNHPACVVAYRA
jgi:FkbM family methyltransferase